MMAQTTERETRSEAAESVRQAESARQAEYARRAEKIDFKMITFSLAGKEYGVDIMNVKEIAKAGRFTYVPNAAPFVRGVYNLRGEIISVIDLRIFFHLPAERKGGGGPREPHHPQDRRARLRGHRRRDRQGRGHFAANSIQPPHPIFGDINVKYIKGIVENSRQALHHPRRGEDLRPRAGPRGRPRLPALERSPPRAAEPREEERPNAAASRLRL